MVAVTDSISLPTLYAAANVAAFLAEHLSWSAFWDKRDGVWRVSEDELSHRGRPWMEGHAAARRPLRPLPARSRSTPTSSGSPRAA
jgi:hypothetical protein